MGAGSGRLPKVNIDRAVNHTTPRELKAREENTPVYEKREFEPPASLSERELATWNNLAKIFKDTHACKVSDADRDLMEIYCKCKSEYDEACVRWADNPKYYILVPTGQKVVRGNVVPTTASKVNPDYLIKRDFGKQCKVYLDQLGLSPIARAKQGIAAAQHMVEENIFAKLMDRSDDE